MLSVVVAACSILADCLSIDELIHSDFDLSFFSFESLQLFSSFYALLGIVLARRLPELVEAGLNVLNISLDTLGMGGSLALKPWESWLA